MYYNKIYFVCLLPSIIFTLYFPKFEKKDCHSRNVVSHVGLFNLLVYGNPESFRTAMRLHLQTQINDMEKNLAKIQPV